MIKLGLMGAGKVASYGHMPAICSVADLELAAIFDPDAVNLRAAQERFGVEKVFTDSEAFFASGIDAVTITSPAPVHLQNVRDAARHGKPVLCEKPLAMDEAEIVAMIDIMDKAGLGLWTGFTYRFSPVAQKIKQLLAEDAIGKVKTLRLVYNWHCHGKYELDERGERVIQKRREGRMLEGGPMVDCGTHQIDLARWWLSSDVAGYEGFGSWVEDYEAPDHMWVHMEHENQAHTMVEISYSYHHTSLHPKQMFIYEFIGSEGVIRFEWETHRLDVFSSRGEQSYYYYDTKNFEGMYEAYARALKHGSDADLATARDGLVATQIARTATNQAMARREELFGKK